MLRRALFLRVSASSLGPLVFAALAFSSTAPAAVSVLVTKPGEQVECTQVCSAVRTKLKANSKLVETEYKQWQERLGVKGDVIRFDQGFSAAEELLRFMSSYYRRHAPGEQMEPTFLAYMMSKCFPEAYIDASRARMSGLVDTIWTAENLRIEQQLNTCK